MTRQQAAFTIRQGQIDDLPRTLELIKELAVFERAPDAVTNTVERMTKEGFGEESIFKFIVAEIENLGITTIVGISIYYYRYSTWKGKNLYLEDLIVTEEYRGRGIGKALFEKTLEIAQKSSCAQMNWQVLDWNQSAIDFYKKYDTIIEDEWLNCKIALE